MNNTMNKPENAVNPRSYDLEIFESEYKSCRICPRECGADRTFGRGFCGCDRNMRIARIAPHLWEEPFLSGMGLEETIKGSGTVFFYGCNLGCIYCQNYRISKLDCSNHAAIPEKSKEIDEKIYSPKALSECFLSLEKNGVHNINLVTAAHYLPSVRETLRIAKSSGLSIPVVYNTSGYEKSEAIASLEGLVDIYLPDMKYLSTKIANDYSHAPDYPSIAKKAITEMYRQTGKPKFDDKGFMLSGTAIRHLVLPGCDADSVKVLEWIRETFGIDGVTVSIMSQYTPVIKGDLAEKYPELTEKLSMRAYLRVVEKAQAIGFKYLYTQELGSASESFIPDFGSINT